MAVFGSSNKCNTFKVLVAHLITLTWIPALLHDMQHCSMPATALNVISSWSNIVLFMKIVSVFNVIDVGDIIYTLLFPAMFNMAITCIDSSSKMIIDTHGILFQYFYQNM